MSWTVYILECGDGSLYIGITNNFPERLVAHESGKGAKYTRGKIRKSRLIGIRVNYVILSDILYPMLLIARSTFHNIIIFSSCNMCKSIISD